MLWCCLLLGQCAHAAVDKTFYSNGLIEAGQEWRWVGVHDTVPGHSTVNMTGGTAVSVSAWDGSTFNFHAGTITQTIGSSDTSTVNILSSGVKNALAYGSSTLNISGSANLSNVSGNSSSTINVLNGTIDVIDMTGGTANLYGGSITGYMWAHQNSIVNVFGTGLSKSGTGGAYGDGWVHGWWQNGSEFTINLVNSGTSSHVNLVPEPVTLLLLGAGAFALRSRRS